MPTQILGHSLSAGSLDCGVEIEVPVMFAEVDGSSLGVVADRVVGKADGGDALVGGEA